MPPEYAQYGDVSPKIDVYAFGVVLYQLISAKEAIVKPDEVITESKGLVALFEEAFNQSDHTESLKKLVDQRLGDDYPFDSVSKVASLAKACTHENPQLRPSMRSIVVALMTLSSSTEDWDIGSFYENQGLVHLMPSPMERASPGAPEPRASPAPPLSPAWSSPMGSAEPCAQPVPPRQPPRPEPSPHWRRLPPRKPHPAPSPAISIGDGLSHHHGSFASLWNFSGGRQWCLAP
ncbi:hypothetical protein RD792_007663 [Penstemon davidsonii]|uniref:Protein kinase domain-containing protein n=1 Tax=Penstemon davidsonii TaxID=160366 RepID=A0ABR0D704_9LAMI|nr:hypothetical protein RD792_007663 [Penstemon davidsonii]